MAGNVKHIPGLDGCFVLGDRLGRRRQGQVQFLNPRFRFRRHGLSPLHWIRIDEHRFLTLAYESTVDLSMKRKYNQTRIGRSNTSSAREATCILTSCCELSVGSPSCLFAFTSRMVPHTMSAIRKRYW